MRASLTRVGRTRKRFDSAFARIPSAFPGPRERCGGFRTSGKGIDPPMPLVDAAMPLLRASRNGVDASKTFLAASRNGVGATWTLLAPSRNGVGATWTLLAPSRNSAGATRTFLAVPRNGVGATVTFLAPSRNGVDAPRPFVDASASGTTKLVGVLTISPTYVVGARTVVAPPLRCRVYDGTSRLAGARRDRSPRGLWLGPTRFGSPCAQMSRALRRRT
jgi:hypothetical protein